MLIKSHPEHRRYTVAVVLLMVGYVGALVGVNMYFDNNSPSGASAYAAATLPALPIIGVLFVMSRLLVTLNDEYQRSLLTRQMLIATGFMLVSEGRRGGKEGGMMCSYGGLR